MRKVKLEKIRIKIEEDTNPDFSWIGKFVDKPEPGVMRADVWKFLKWQFGEPVDVPERNREYRFFQPYAGGEKTGTKNYYKYAKQDAELMRKISNGNVCFLNIRVNAEIHIPIDYNFWSIQTISSGYVGGVLSDSKDFVMEVVREHLEELRITLIAMMKIGRKKRWEKLVKEAIEEMEKEYKF